MRGGYPTAWRPAASAYAQLRPSTAARAVPLPAHTPAAFQERLYAYAERVGARRIAAEAAEGFATGLIRGATGVGTALLVFDLASLAYAVYTYEEPGSVTVGPRTSDADLALAFGPGWSHRVTSWTPSDAAPAFPLDGTQRYYRPETWGSSMPTGERDGSSNLVLRKTSYDDFDAHKSWLGQYVTRVDEFSAVADPTAFPIGAEVVRYQRYSKVGDATGTLDYEGWTKQSNAAADVTFANPAPTVVTPGVTRTVVLPLAPPATVPWADIPYVPRHPLSDAGQPSTPLPIFEPAVVFVPPTIVIAPPGAVPSPVSGVIAEPVGPGREPPGKGEKERKVKIRRGRLARIAFGIVGVGPELLDAVNALWKVLPDECKSGSYKLHGRGGKVFYKQRWRPSQAQRMKDLYRCWPHMDMSKAIGALIANQVEDEFYGRIGSATGKAGARLGMDRGLGFGIWDSETSDLLKKAGFKSKSPVDFGALQKWLEDGSHALGADGLSFEDFWKMVEKGWWNAGHPLA